MAINHVPISKTKIKGNEFKYSNSLRYEWYVKFQDNHIITMFDNAGNDTTLFDAYAYKNTSPIIEVGVIAFAQEKADIINENKTHEYTVIASSNKTVSRSINPSQVKNPYIIRRKLFIPQFNRYFWFYGLGNTEIDSSYRVILDYTGQNRELSTTIINEWI